MTTLNIGADLVSGSVLPCVVLVFPRQIPFLGGICQMVGHFPVFFQSQDENSFAVDKSEQAKIMEKVKKNE